MSDNDYILRLDDTMEEEEAVGQDGEPQVPIAMEVEAEAQDQGGEPQVPGISE